MTFKFSRPAAVTASILAGMLLALPGGLLHAQTTAPTPSPSPTPKPKVGFIRFWNMQPIGSSNLELVLANSGPPERVLQNAPACNYYQGYLNLPPGTYPLKLFRAGERATALKTFNVPLQRNAYLTLLATQAPDGKVNAEMLDDTPDPTKPVVNRLTVRQFIPDIHVVVTTADRQRTNVLDLGGSQTLEGLPNGLVSLSAKATLASGVVRGWNAQVDFRSAHRASLLVFADSFGRIRPRVSVDGPPPDIEAENTAEAMANSANATSPAPSP